MSGLFTVTIAQLKLILCSMLSPTSRKKISGFKVISMNISGAVVFFIHTLHLLQIPSDRELCVDVKFNREFYVGAVQAVPVNVYDYYKPGKP